MIRLATRSSLLALRQTELARETLGIAWPHQSFEIVPMVSEGDLRSELPLGEFGDKAVFVRRLEQALLEGSAEIAVHSLKDLPVEDIHGLSIAAVLPREDPRDALITRGGTLTDLAPGARVGTSSARRRAQLELVRPDLEFLDIRGNVETRLRKLDSGEFDAIVLAAAGLIRLGLANRITEYLEPHLCLPAPGQGTIALQCRTNASFTADLQALTHHGSHRAVNLERALGQAVGADCHSAFGALATVDGASETLQGFFKDDVGNGRRVSGRASAGAESELIDTLSRELAGTTVA